MSARRACDVVQLDRSTLYYRSHTPDQTLLRMRLRDLAAARVRYGYRRLHVLLRREGWLINHNRVYRLYRLDGLNLRLKRTRKRVSQIRVVPPAATAAKERWSMDFMSDRLYDGRRFRILTLVDTVSRVSPAIEIDRSMTGERVVEAARAFGEPWLPGSRSMVSGGRRQQWVTRWRQRRHFVRRPASPWKRTTSRPGCALLGLATLSAPSEQTLQWLACCTPTRDQDKPGLNRRYSSAAKRRR